MQCMFTIVSYKSKRILLCILLVSHCFVSACILLPIDTVVDFADTVQCVCCSLSVKILKTTKYCFHPVAILEAVDD